MLALKMTLPDGYAAFARQKESIAHGFAGRGRALKKSVWRRGCVAAVMKQSDCHQFEAVSHLFLQEGYTVNYVLTHFTPPA